MLDSSPENLDRLRGVHHAKDFADDIQLDWQSGISPGEESDWPLDEFYKVKKQQWSVVTGIPSHGKSTWLDNLMVRLARGKGWKFLVCSPENQPISRHIESLVEIHSGRKFQHPDNAGNFRYAAITQDELIASYAFVDKHFQFICPEETDFNIDYILELASQIKNDPHTPFAFDGFVLDPYNELEHKRPNAMTETEYISSILSKFRRFARSEDCHSWMVAHPAKLKEIPMQADADVKTKKLYAMPSLYDIAGSAHWRNKADMGVVIYRNINHKPETTTVSIQKVRFRECGSLGEVDFFYDFLCNRYVAYESELLFNQRGI